MRGEGRTSGQTSPASVSSPLVMSRQLNVLSVVGQHDPRRGDRQAGAGSHERLRVGREAELVRRELEDGLAGGVEQREGDDPAAGRGAGAEEAQLPGARLA